MVRENRGSSEDEGGVRLGSAAQANWWLERAGHSTVELPQTDVC